MNRTACRYWINRKTNTLHTSRGMQTMDPMVWEEISLEEYLTKLLEARENSKLRG